MAGQIMPLDLCIAGRLTAIDIQALSAGLYFLHIENDEGREVLKFVKGIGVNDISMIDLLGDIASCGLLMFKSNNMCRVL